MINAFWKLRHEVILELARETANHNRIESWFTFFHKFELRRAGASGNYTLRFYRLRAVPMATLVFASLCVVWTTVVACIQLDPFHMRSEYVSERLLRLYFIELGFIASSLDAMCLRADILREGFYYHHITNELASALGAQVYDVSETAQSPSCKQSDDGDQPGGH